MASWRGYYQTIGENIMSHYDRIDLGTREVNINNICVLVNIYALLQYDPDHCFDGEYEPGELEEMERKIHSGEWKPTIIEVVATAYDCEKGTDIMGNCVVADTEDVNDFIADYDMINNALAALVTATLARAASLAKFVA